VLLQRRVSSTALPPERISSIQCRLARLVLLMRFY